MVILPRALLHSFHPRPFNWHVWHRFMCLMQGDESSSSFYHIDFNLLPHTSRVMTSGWFFSQINDLYVHKTNHIRAHYSSLAYIYIPYLLKSYEHQSNNEHENNICHQILVGRSITMAMVTAVYTGAHFNASSALPYPPTPPPTLHPQSLFAQLKPTPIEALWSRMRYQFFNSCKQVPYHHCCWVITCCVVSPQGT